MLQCHMHKDDTEASQVNKRALTAPSFQRILVETRSVEFYRLALKNRFKIHFLNL
jgi:hypothetical protein